MMSSLWNFPTISTIGMLVAGLLVGGFLSVLDSKYLHSFYGGVGKITNSVVFLAALLPVALFIVTTTGSALGIGLIIGFELKTTAAMLTDQRNIDDFSNKYLFQLARKLTKLEIQILVAIQTLITLLLILLVFL